LKRDLFAGFADRSGIDADKKRSNREIYFMGVKLKTRQVGDVTVIDVSGRITLDEASCSIREEVHELMSTEKRKILMNLAGVSYIDSSGIGELLAGFSIAANAGGALKLLCLTKGAKELLRVTQPSGVFEVHEEEANAVRSFA
jgi:anti-sigma B factor antagonist